jgi:acyl-CoA reductase-like NAD-dependent aldehyde dehydrogenase
MVRPLEQGGETAAAARSDATRTITVTDPARGVAIAAIPVQTAAEVAEAAARARAAQPGWAALAVRERGRVLKRARRALVRARAEVLDLLGRETGKPRFDVVGELMGTCMDLGYLVRRAPRVLRPRRVSARPLFFKRALVTYRPRGLVGVISPWNAPLNLALGDALPALLAGNTVIIKPSEVTPLAVRRAAAALGTALPAGVLQVVTGDGTTGAALVDHADMVCVTGSPGTGKAVMERAARRLTPVLLELGGKDPMIVLRDADLERAANGAVWGGFMMAGQVCMSVERVYVEAPVAEEFTRRVVEKVAALRLGANDPGAEIDVGPLTTPRQVEIVERHVADAVARGARVLTGGRRRSGPGLFYEPTVLAGVDHGMAIMREETFGPVVPIMAVADAEEALRLANESTLGLNGSVWTRDVERGIALARRLETGSACVNECLVSAGCIELPFGGVKESGVGTRHGGPEALRAFCVAQSILVDRRGRRREPMWFPYSRRTERFVERLLPLLFR